MNAEQLLQHFERISEAPDAIPSLRRFILNLAVRGKLVEQDPSDEPATELLKRIATEKARAGGRNKELTPIEELEISHAAPESWAWTRMGNVFSIRTGFAFKSSTYTKTGTLVFRVTNFNRDGSFDLADSVFFPTDKIDAKMSGFLLKPDEIIMVMVGGTIGKTTIVDASILPALLNQNMWRIRSHGGLLLSRYEYLLIKNINHSVHGLTQSTHGHFAMSDYEKRVFPLPPLAEQHRIVAKVDELMSLCDQLEAAKAEGEKCRDSLVAASLQRLNQPVEEEETFREHARFVFNNLARITTRTAHIKQLRQTILNLAVRGKLISQDPSDEPAEEQLERIMEAKMLHGRKARATKKKHAAASDEVNDFHLSPGWATAPLADLVTVLNGRAYKQSELLDAGTPVLRVGNLFTSNKWYYSDLELDDDKYCDDGDLIFSWSASFGPFIWNGGRTIYHYHIWKLPLHSPDDLSRDYLYLYLLDKTAEIKAAGHGISMVHMTKEKMEQLEVPLPPLAEQHRIVAKVDELMAICDLLEAQITAREQDSRRFLESVLADALALGIDLSAEAEVA